MKTRKFYFFVLCVLIQTGWIPTFSIIGNANAQVPNKISYQGLLTTSAGTPVIDGSYNLQFDIYNLTVGGILKYTETQTGIPISKGTFSVILRPTSTIFADSLFVEVTALAGPSISSPITFSPRSELSSAPYSLAPWTTIGSNISFMNGNVGIGTTSPDAPLVISGNGTSWAKGFLFIKNDNNDAGIRLYDRVDSVKHHIFNDNGSGDRLRIAPVGNYGSGGITINQTGDVGIGTTSPNEQLEITGNLRLPASTASVGVIKSGGDRFIHNFGANNFFAGVNAGNLTMTGSSNTGVGVNALLSNTTGYANTTNGASALRSNTTGYANTANGASALRSNTTGDNNTANGQSALYSNTEGSANTANGAGALYSNTTGWYNTANGLSALYSNTSGDDNTANGNAALFSNTTGNNNTANGRGALRNNTTGNNNTANGLQALYSNTEGFNNTALGYYAGYNVTTGSNLTLIGYNAQPTSASATNQITLGNASVTSLRCAVTTITALSDARDKKNIQELSLGLDFISKLKPRQFNWDKREWYGNNISDGSKMQEAPTAGFIAQELDEVQKTQNTDWLNLVLKDNPEKIEATPGNLLPIMVKAIQELNKNSIEIRAKSEELRAENKELKARLSELEAVVKSLAEEKKLIENKSLGELR